MKRYLGVTDTGWFRHLSGLNPPPEDINFWQPRGSQGFRVLPVGGPFLFKLKAPLNAIGGVGFLPLTHACRCRWPGRPSGRATGREISSVFGIRS